MNNYEFVADWAARTLPPGSMMLDYGCGAGQIVRLARDRDLEAYGCDTYYAGGDYSGLISEDEWGSTIFEMTDATIPFPDGSFDLVTNNQVIEHVDDLDAVLTEIARVLKPGGLLLSLFPDKAVWREGHCGIPFAHRFHPESRWRDPYVRFMRTAGLGYFKGGKSVSDWTRDTCKWLDEWTHYRDIDTIRRAFARHYETPSELEVLWFDARVGRKLPLPRAVKRFVALKCGNRALVVRKPAS